MPQFETIPASVTSIKPPVETLYYEGDSTLLAGFKVAIVGSRKASNYSKSMTYELALALKNAGATVVSGAAMGIDAMAHKGSFPKTIAVMGNSLDMHTPRVNSGLIASIEKEGLVLSEYPPTTHPTRYSYVDRNRIVVGLSDVVVLAEADLKSGTMHSARFALEFGKPIYVFSHRMDESLGTQSLLESGQAEAIVSIKGFIKAIGLAKTVSAEMDDLLAFCAKHPFYDDTVALFKEKLFEYELMGKVRIENGRVYPV